MSRKDRILGALLGVHAGDSLGASYEFNSWSALQDYYPNGIPHDIVGGGPFGWSPGHATDDTDMTRAVLLAYKHCTATHAADATDAKDSRDSLALATVAGNYMLDWYEGRWPGRRLGSRPVDAGGATRVGLSTFSGSNPRDPRRAGAGQGQAGNGSLMRCIPTALFADKAALVEESALVSAVTHDDARCVLACAAYNTIVAALVDGVLPADAVEAGLAVLSEDTVELIVATFTGDDGEVVGTLTKENLLEALPQVQSAISKGKAVRVGDLAELGPDEAPGGKAAIPLHASGYVLESLTLGIAAVLDTDRTTEDLLVDVVSVGRDTDTNGAVAGGLLGARDGVEGIPALWRSKLQFGQEFTEIVNSLVK
ncbi:adp-ribosylglycohydrolase family protein [Ophiostoma piceae UAMH 11346]|uniref:ADP-ribosylhydrolase ARH3 n=1 Tax=Ophiostoma piceae (strain UAMH 11346) TaxID=1262450 RepID=S3CFE0_OPHP1|nr:adp-ribosylglycohydrolase family protein [Ophiostoma piceae UAMH 11346]